MVRLSSSSVRRAALTPMMAIWTLLIGGVPPGLGGQVAVWQVFADNEPIRQIMRRYGLEE
jgi:hypothetical protein